MEPLPFFLVTLVVVASLAYAFGFWSGNSIKLKRFGELRDMYERSVREARRSRTEEP